MIRIVAWCARACAAAFPLLALGLVAATGTFLTLAPRLPSVEALRDVRFQEPLRVFTRDGLLMGEFGEMRRTPVHFGDVPQPLIQAFLAAEDDRFLQHSGIDVFGLLRAAWELAVTHSIQSGGSTITMQVARNYFLSREQSFIRKFNEILLAVGIERELDKQQILELYLNKIFLGYRAYGVEAASQVYFGIPIGKLSIAQSATIAALPKAPSTLNPLDNPVRALERRDWILRRMLELGYIDQASFESARAEPLGAIYHGSSIEVPAQYAAEMVRTEMLARFGRAAYLDGYEVDTTIDSRLQNQAHAAVRRGLMAYDGRHGWRGAEAHWDDDREEWPARLAGIAPVSGLRAVAVTRVGEKDIDVLDAEGAIIGLGWEQGLSSARRLISENYRGAAPKTASDVVSVGDVVRLTTQEDGTLRLTQIPAAQAALVSLDASDGAVQALVGGLDFRHSKFNRVTQAERQPGSNIKPFIYAAAMEHGFSPASIINDAPVVFEDPGLDEVWRPENDTGKFYGPTSLRTGLVNSRNLVSIRLLQQLGIPVAVDYLARLGFPLEKIPPNLSLALGTLSTTPMHLITAYAALANGGFGIKPYVLREVRRRDGTVLEQAQPARACPVCTRPATAFEEAESMDTLLADEPPAPDAAAPEQAEAPVAPQVMDPRVAYMIDSILKDAVKFGTGRRALELQRNDIAGKTGTTNGPTDAWFSGYVGHIVSTAWLGFDQNLPLGRQEYGGSAALPVWVDYMREATRDLPPQERLRPDGLVSVRVDPKTGLLASPGQTDASFELFTLENAPTVTPNGDEFGNPDAPDEYDTHEIF